MKLSFVQRVKRWFSFETLVDSSIGSTSVARINCLPLERRDTTALRSRGHKWNRFLSLY